MSEIKGIELLGISPSQVETLQHRAAQHMRFSSIDFKVLEVGPEAVAIRIRQGASHAGNYFDAKRLIEITHETFDDLLPKGMQIRTRPIPYRPSPPDVVTREWLQEQRGQRKTKDIAHDLGIDANMVSAYIGGQRPLSNVVRAMFYYYFTNQKQQ